MYRQIAAYSDNCSISDRMHPMETLHIESQTELVGVVDKTLELLTQKKVSEQASVLVLTGDLGAGKTTFTKLLASSLGVEGEITSPTFVIMKRYEGDTKVQKQTSFSYLCHIDAYRIDDIDEMRPLRFEEILQEADTLVCIEWGEKIQELLPAHTLTLNIEITGTESRTITFS